LDGFRGNIRIVLVSCTEYLRIVGLGWRWGWRILEVIQKGDHEFTVLLKRRNIKGILQSFLMSDLGYIVKIVPEKCEGYIFQPCMKLADVPCWVHARM